MKNFEKLSIVVPCYNEEETIMLFFEEVEKYKIEDEKKKYIFRANTKYIFSSSIFFIVIVFIASNSLYKGITGIEKNIIFENVDIFKDFGFDIDEFSENEIVIRAVPAFDFRDSIENVFLQLLLDLKNEVEIKDLRENIIISMSCKGAVKAGQKLDMFEMQNMVRRIHEVGKYTCPHGRPIIVKLSKNDLDKMFGRKK